MAREQNGGRQPRSSDRIPRGTSFTSRQTVLPRYTAETQTIGESEVSDHFSDHALALTNIEQPWNGAPRAFDP
jgi:hypothetical protein